MKHVLTILLALHCLLGYALAREFVHPGCLSTQADLDRMQAQVAADKQPWSGSWQLLLASRYSRLDYRANPQEYICAGKCQTGENYMALARDCAAAYQLALRYHISGDGQYADKAVELLNAWSARLKAIQGDTNASLRAGLYGYQLACSGELLRNYPSWSKTSQNQFKSMLENVFYPVNHNFLTNHHGTCESHYWANWDLANMAALLAIGVYCDNSAIFDEGLQYFYHGSGEGAIANAVHFIHPDGTGQWQESGRDQGHNTLGIALMAVVCEIAWNQGEDLYGYDNNRFLAGCEYVAKYNLMYEVPYVTYINCENVVQPAISPGARGAIRPGWEMVYNHYVNRKGVAAPYTAIFAEKVRPEGGGGNYGNNSGGFDQFGFSSLTHSLAPTGTSSAPSSVTAYTQGTSTTISWHGTANAVSYFLQRSENGGQTYIDIAQITGNDLCYTDKNLSIGKEYLYKVWTKTATGSRLESQPIAVLPDNRLTGKIIGTEGSFNNKGADINTVCDGSLKNYFDGPETVSWVGLDLGDAGMAAITQIRYCPRPGYAQRMVGGIFQTADDPQFTRGVTELFKITAEPPCNTMTSQIINPNIKARYVRYLSPKGGFGNVSEIEYYGRQ